MDDYGPEEGFWRCPKCGERTDIILVFPVALTAAEWVACGEGDFSGADAIDAINFTATPHVLCEHCDDDTGTADWVELSRPEEANS